MSRQRVAFHHIWKFGGDPVWAAFYDAERYPKYTGGVV